MSHLHLLEYGQSHITKPHPKWSHLSITGPGPPSSPAIGGSLKRATSATTTVLQPSQSASPTPAGGKTEARSPAQSTDTFEQTSTPPATLLSRTLQPHQPVLVVPKVTWLTSAIPVPAAEQTTNSLLLSYRLSPTRRNPARVFRSRFL